MAFHVLVQALCTVVVIVCLCSSSVSAFVPKTSGRNVSFARYAAISPGDTVLVLGGTGGVGQLVTKKLTQAGYKVRVTARDKSRAEETIADSTVDIVQLGLTGNNCASEADLTAAMKDCAAIVCSVGTTAFPTLKWAGGNTPQAIDKEAVTKIANAACNISSMKKFLIVTSVGVDRTEEMPFKVLNLCGVLDAKRSGEEAVKAAAARAGFDFVCVRPGRLVGGPFTNLDVARLLQIEGGAENGVTLEAGDSLLGDCKRDAVSEAVIECLQSDKCKNIEFSIISNEDEALTTDEWAREFQRLCPS